MNYHDTYTQTEHCKLLAQSCVFLSSAGVEQNAKVKDLLLTLQVSLQLSYFNHFYTY